MLEQTRRQASIFVYIIFGLLIVIFIYGINPGNRGGSDGGGCSVNNNSVVAVNGTDVGESAYRIAYSMFQGQARQRTYSALDQVTFRELLAQAAEDRGIRTTGDLIDDEIKSKRGYFYLGGQRIDVSSQFFEDGFFKHRRWLDWIAARNMQSPGAYKEEQARSLQAALMADLITHSVRVSRDEALQSYLYDNNTVTYDVVAFEPGRYRRAMHPTDADTRRYLDAHTAEVEARYKADERTYKGVKPQLALREIFIPKAAPAAAKPDDAKPADKTAKPADKTAKADDKAKPARADDKAKPARPGDKAAKPARPGDKARPDDKTAKADAADQKPAAGDAAAAKPYGLPTDAAKTKLEALRAEIAAGKLTFPDAEKQVAADASDDAPAENGDRGWQSIEKLGLGDKAVTDAVKALKPGEMTPVIVTERGVYLVTATGKREGDLSFDQVKMEIAANLARDAWSKEAAKRAALDALAKVQASGKGLDQMFEKEQVAPPSGGGIEQLLQDPNLTQEQKQKILEQLLQQQKHGSLDVHEEDVPVGWFADADGSATTPAAPTGGSAPAPAAPAGGSAPAPAGGSPSPASGTAAPAAGGGSGAGSAAAPGAPAAPAPDIVASTDPLPQFGEVDKPKVNRFGPTPREAKMPGIGASKAAIDALFDELSPGNVAKKIYEGDNGAYVVVQLINRAQPKAEDFDKTADAEIARMQEARGKAALYSWLRSRCDALTKAGRIRPAADRIRETDDKGNPAPTVYRPCMTLDFLDR
jgi:SurA-like protein/PPIC-type peptidyl-prolyl cis-trans isomerase-like protein